LFYDAITQLAALYIQDKFFEIKFHGLFNDVVSTTVVESR